MNYASVRRTLRARCFNAHWGDATRLYTTRRDEIDAMDFAVYYHNQANVEILDPGLGAMAKYIKGENQFRNNAFVGGVAALAIRVMGHNYHWDCGDYGDRKNPFFRDARAVLIECLGVNEELAAMLNAPEIDRIALIDAFDALEIPS